MSHSEQRSSVASAAIAVTDYLRTRFPLHTHGIAVLATALCAICSYELARTGTVGLRAADFVGALGMVLLFLHLRLVDDLDDLDDMPSGRLTRRGLRIGLVAVLVAVVALNILWPWAMAVALAAMALALLAPFVLKRRFPRNRTLLAVGYEGAPLLALAYGYFQWADGRTAPALAVIGVVGAFWAAYEFWKFSRKAGEDAYQPYGLPDPALRLVLWGLLALMAACVVVLAYHGGFSWFFVGYGCVVPAVFALWLARSWRGQWRGLLLVETLVAAVVIEAVF